jgi:alpha-glucosidase (family GH31 glycosyl hydrolase)
MEPAVKPLSHRPYGTEHPYRYDLDQRVPARPVVGERYEIRVLADPSVDAVEVVFADGRRLGMTPTEPAELVTDYGPPPAVARAADGHLAAASASDAGADGRAVWVARVLSDCDTSYEVSGGGDTLGPFPVRPGLWRTDGGDLSLVDSSGLIAATDVGWLVDTDGPRRVRFALPLRAGEHVVGFGERFHALDQRGEKLDVTVFEQYKRQGHRTYLPVPFAIVTGPHGSWGFHVQTTRRSWYDVGLSTPDRIGVEVDVNPADPAVRVRIFHGSPADIVHAFVASLGAAATPPDWVFRLWMSGNEWNTQSRVMAEVGRSLSEGIPVGAVVIEAWSDEATFTTFRDAQYPLHADGAPHRLEDFAFPPEGAWPDPKGMVEALHASDVKVLLWQIPLIPTDRGEGEQVEADAQALVRGGFAVQEADGSPHHNRGWWFPGALLPDFTNPDAVDWWLAKRRYLVDEIGVDGFKTDGGEHPWGYDLRYADGTRGDETNNRFPVLYAQAYHRLTDVTFSRAGFTGAGAVPCHWAGDEDSTWDAFRASITAGITAGVSGISLWGWDLAGFSGEIPDVELYLRAAAMACFCPIMQYHSEFNHHRSPSRDRTPWNIAERTGDPSVLGTFRRFAKLRETLVPYLGAQARVTLDTGRPLMRALFFDHGDDERVWDWPLQYQLGDDLLVAPVTEPGATSWQVYLPAGQWTDFFTGEVHNGPVVVDRPVPLTEIPVYRRAA